MSILGGAIEQRWSLENPNWHVVGEAWGAEATHSGAHVNATTALGHADVWACIRVISEAVGTLPMPVYRRLEGGKERAGSTLVGRLFDRPSPSLTTSALLTTIVVHLATWGNAYVAKFRGARGEVVQLGLVAPSRVSVEIVGGEPVYVVASAGDGRGFSGRLNRRDLIHVKALSVDGVVGLSPIRQARQAIGLGMSLDEYAGRLMGDGAFPAGVLKSPTKLNDEQRKQLRDSWDKMHRGPKRAGRPAVLENGLEYEPIGLPPGDAQFVEQRRLSATQIARIFRVPAYMINADAGSSMTYANVEQASIQLVTYTLRPYMVMIEEAFNADDDLFDGSGSLFCEFLIDALLRADTLTRYQAHALALGGAGKPGWKTVNEIRETDNLSHVDGGDALFDAAGTSPTAAVVTP